MHNSHQGAYVYLEQGHCMFFSLCVCVPCHLGPCCIASVMTVLVGRGMNSWRISEGFHPCRGRKGGKRKV